MRILTADTGLDDVGLARLAAVEVVAERHRDAGGGSIGGPLGDRGGKGGGAEAEESCDDGGLHFEGLVLLIVGWLLCGAVEYAGAGGMMLMVMMIMDFILSRGGNNDNIYT